MSKPMMHRMGPIVLSLALFAVAVVLLVLAGLARADDGLVAYYTFEEGPSAQVQDASGYGNHGTIVDDVQYVKLEGEAGYALKFNSGKATVDCGNTPSLDLTEAVTLALWFYPLTTVQKGEGGVIGKVMGSYCLSYSGSCWFYVPKSSNYIKTSPLDLAWHHVAATFDGKSVSFYVDGRLHNTQPSKETELPHGENFYLRYPNTYLTVEPEYKCMMDNVRVYRRALSGEEITRIYQQEAKATGLHDASWFEKVHLKAHRFPESSTLVVEADFSRMSVRSPGAVLELKLRRGADQKPIASHEFPAAVTPEDNADETPVRLEFQDLARAGVKYWTQSLAKLPPGKHEIGAVIKDRAGNQVGERSSLALDLPLAKPDWIKAYDGVKVLNNLVAELVNIPAPQAEAQKEYVFSNPRNGWIFISSTAAVADDDDEVLICVDTEPAPAIAHRKGEKETLEAMRYLPGGVHRLHIRCRGVARPSAVVVRAIPEMMVAGLGYHKVPLLSCFGHYNMAYLDRIGMLDSINTLVERTPVSENAAYVKAWRQQGKRLIVRYGMWQLWQENPGVDGLFKAWTADRGLSSDDYDGLNLDEFSGSGHGGVGNYPLYAEVARMIARDPRFAGKVFYPYCMPMYPGDTAMQYLDAVVDSGYKWAEEKYLVEQPDEAAARGYMDLRLRENVLNYERTFPGTARHMITTLGFMSAPPETLNVHPGVDFKVYMDMQMNLLANDPVFFGLYGLQWYHNGYADEEDLRWSVKLFRHYGIEGRRDRLTNDPYLLPHITNPDFDAGTDGWTLHPAEAGSMRVEHAPGHGILQTRTHGGNEQVGDNFLLTTRSAKSPNRFSQTIRELTPGRQYSVKMFTADYDEMQSGKSEPQTHHVRIELDGVELIAGKEFHQVFASGMAGHVYGPFKDGNHLYLTYHRIVFRPGNAQAVLTVSDWAGDDQPGGPTGQRLMFNFFEVQPYLEDPDFVPPPMGEDGWLTVHRRNAQVVGTEVPVVETTPTARYLFSGVDGDTAANAVADGSAATLHGVDRVRTDQGGALRFDGGKDDYVQVTDSAPLNITGGNLTVECWFKVNDPKATWRGLCGNYHSGTGGYMLVYMGEDSIGFYNGSPPGGPAGGSGASDGRWHHAVGVVDNGTMILYMDGVQVGSVAERRPVKSSTYPFEIGRYLGGNAFSGEIDDVAVYDSALSVMEIKKRYSDGRQ